MKNVNVFWWVVFDFLTIVWWLWILLFIGSKNWRKNTLSTVSMYTVFSAKMWWHIKNKNKNLKITRYEFYTHITRTKFTSVQQGISVSKWTFTSFCRNNFLNFSYEKCWNLFIVHKPWYERREFQILFWNTGKFKI